MGMYDDDLLGDREDDDWEEDSISITKCECIHTTDRGYLIRVYAPKSYREAWFPKSFSQYEEGTGLRPNSFIYASWLTPDWQHTYL